MADYAHTFSLTAPDGDVRLFVDGQEFPYHIVGIHVQDNIMTVQIPLVKPTVPEPQDINATPFGGIGDMIQVCDNTPEPDRRLVLEKMDDDEYVSLRYLKYHDRLNKWGWVSDPDERTISEVYAHPWYKITDAYQGEYKVVRRNAP